VCVQMDEFRTMKRSYLVSYLNRMTARQKHMEKHHSPKYCERHSMPNVPICRVCHLPITVGQHYAKLSTHSNKFTHDYCYTLAFLDGNDVEEEIMEIETT